MEVVVINQEFRFGARVQGYLKATLEVELLDNMQLQSLVRMLRGIEPTALTNPNFLWPKLMESKPSVVEPPETSIFKESEEKSKQKKASRTKL